VVESIEAWQTCRTARNLAAHDYEIDYAAIAEHFNTLSELVQMLYTTSSNLLDYCAASLGISPADGGLRQLFQAAVTRRVATVVLP
jgi:hypothetical protein